MKYKVDNAVIMAAGVSSRFAPLSYELPKALLTVKGEVLIERQIKQLKEAGIDEIIIVVGYMKEKFEYLKEKYNVLLVENKEYSVRNNHSSIYAIRNYLKNTYICSADNYFVINPFEAYVTDSYYAAVYAVGNTNEWCIETDDEGYIVQVMVGGANHWYMLGHVFWDAKFSRRFRDILEKEYDKAETIGKYWESIYMEHLDNLKLKVRKYPSDYIYEFDSLDELREFDVTYRTNTRSKILNKIASFLNCAEEDLKEIMPKKDMDGKVKGICFRCNNKIYEYIYEEGILIEMIDEVDRKRIQELINKICGGEQKILVVSRMGGLTNRTYLVEIQTGKYVVRLPGEGTEELINRIDEKVSTTLACELGIDAKLVLFDENTGEKITEYIDDSKTMNAYELRKESNIILVANTLKKLHQSKKDTKVLFDVIEVAKTYEDVILKNKVFLYHDYEEVKKYITNIKNDYLSNITKVPCHNDPLCENWVLQKDETMYLIDWEYAGMNDPMWDLADVSIEADYTREMDKLLLESYFGRNLTKEDWEALFINKVLIDYLWSLWGKTRVPYDGESMERYAHERYLRMQKNMKFLR